MDLQAYHNLIKYLYILKTGRIYQDIAAWEKLSDIFPVYRNIYVIVGELNFIIYDLFAFQFIFLCVLIVNNDYNRSARSTK